MSSPPVKILGISAFYHDSAAALLVNGEIVAAAQEERFSRIKHDPEFPFAAIKYCLGSQHLEMSDIDYVVFYDKPFLKFERLLETLIYYCPKSLPAFISALPVWIKEKLFIKQLIRKNLKSLVEQKQNLPQILFSSHHQAHAASAYFPGPFESSAVLCMDGVGEWATTSAWHARKNQLDPLWQIDFPHSLGLLYSAFTSYTGFRVNSGEYKLMGLAPYGEPRFKAKIFDELIDVKADGSFRLNMKYFAYCYTNRMTNNKFAQLFGGEPRTPESVITQREMDLASSVQKAVEDVVVSMCRTLQKQTGENALSLAGGVALNCVSNSEILKRTDFQDIWIQPAAGDAGGAIGASLAAWHQYLEMPRDSINSHRDDLDIAMDRMQGSYLGPEFSNEEVAGELSAMQARSEFMNEDALLKKTAELLADKKIIGWFQGRMEFGPRALGGRSILADPRDREMQTKLNLSIKYRESFRPFAPAVLASKVEKYFKFPGGNPYMVLVSEVTEDQRLVAEDSDNKGIEKLKTLRSTLPAITHVDFSARVQTVDGKYNQRFHGLLEQFDALTACPILVNTSFNVRGEPIVCRPMDAYRCFMNTEMDYLVIGNYLLSKTEQPEFNADAGQGSVENATREISQVEKNDLRKFGISLAALILVMFGFVFPFFGESLYPVWPWITAAIIAVTGFLLPRLMKTVKKVWIGLGDKIGRVVTPVTLTLIYCLLIFPLSLFLKRSLKKGPFEEIDASSDSYFKASDNQKADNMRNPF